MVKNCLFLHHFIWATNDICDREKSFFFF